jgi:ATP-dependent helicase/nuclease subunit A
MEPADRAARERVRNELDGPMVVEASAGTGKTTVLLDRALAYVESGARRMSEIAIVTFTELAAAELRERLRGRILERLAAGDAASRPRWQQALADLEIASVGTIHSFCVDLLRRRPVEAGLDPDFGVADEMAREMLVDEAWEEHLYALEPGDPGFEAALDVGLERPADLRRAAGQLLVFGEADMPLAPGERPLVLPSVEQARDLLLAAESRAQRNGSLHKQIVKALVWCEETLALGERESARELARGGAPSILYGKKASELAAMELRDRAGDVLDEAQSEIFEWLWRSAARWLGGLRARYERLAAERSLVDFDRQIADAVELLRAHPQVRRALGRQYPVILIDEFQDTDRDQIELARLLAEGGADGGDRPRSLFVVGDPKQSIYRFRAADLENYRRFVEAISAAAVVRLTQSFRAAPALAAWINAELGRVMVRPLGEPYEVDYSPLVAAPAAPPPAGALQGVVQLAIDVDPDWSVEPAREAEADALARLARALVDGRRGWVRERDGAQRRARWGDVALLLPRFTILEPYEAALRRHQVPYRTEAGRAYYRRDETHALTQILRALADPGDAVAVVAALRGPGFGCSDHELLAYALASPRPRFDLAAPPADAATSPEPAAAARTAAALARLRALAASCRGLPLADRVQRAIDEAGLLAFHRLLWRGEQRVANLEKAVDQARRLEELGQSSLQAFVRWLTARGEGEYDEGDAPAIEHSESAIRVLTVHKAKGLEFPVVLLGGMVGQSGSGPSDRLKLARDRSGERPGRVEARVGRGMTRGFEAALQSEEVREKAERKRLLYVAVTRARDLLALPWMPGLKKTVDLYRLLFNKDGAEWEGSPLAARLAASELPAGPAPEGESPQVEAVLADPAGEPPEFAGAAAPEPQLPAEARGAIARAERRGRAIHALIAAGLNGAAPPDLLELDEAERLAAREAARRFAASPLGRRALAAAERLVETALSRSSPGGAAIDLRLDLAFGEDGGWVLVDYKSDRQGARTTPEREWALRAQLAVYAEALEQLTGMPVREAHLAFLMTGETLSFTRLELGGG